MHLSDRKGVTVFIQENISILMVVVSVNVSARSSKLPIGERCTPVGEQSSQGVCLGTGTFPFANGLVCEKNSFLFTLYLRSVMDFIDIR